MFAAARGGEALSQIETREMMQTDLFSSAGFPSELAAAMESHQNPCGLAREPDLPSQGRLVFHQAPALSFPCFVITPDATKTQMGRMEQAAAVEKRQVGHWPKPLCSSTAKSGRVSVPSFRGSGRNTGYQALMPLGKRVIARLSLRTTVMAARPPWKTER